MATSGSSRRRRGGAATCVLAVGLAVVLAGCSTGSGPAPSTSGTPGPVGSATASPAPTGSPSTSGSAAPAPSDDEPCEVDLPATWRDALGAGVVAPRSGEELTVALGTADGRVFVVSRRGERQRFEWRRGDERGLVQDFGTHEEWQVLAPTWDGRYLAYRVDHSFSNFEDFSVYVWDSQSDASPVEVAHGERGADGELMQTPFVDPVLADGWVYWTQTRDRDGEHTTLSGRRLRDGKVERLSTGYGRAPVRFGDTLVWADSDRAGETSSLRMLDLATHRSRRLPAALADVTGTYYLAGDTDTLVWVAGSRGSQVSVWRTGWTAPRLLVTGAASAQFPRVAGDTVVYATDDAMEVGDLRSWSSARLTPEYGSVWADGAPVVTVGFAPTTKGGASVQTVLDTAAVGPLGRVGC